MSARGPHSDVDPQRAIQHLKSDFGLPIANPLPSLWQDPLTLPIATHQSESLPSDTDVVIIGSGITGTSVAQNLLKKDPTIKVTMLEARTITSGATGRNGGHILVVPELFFAGTFATQGKELAKEFVNFTLDNQDALLRLMDSLDPSFKQFSELRRLEVLHVFSSEQARANAQAWVNLLAKEFPEVRQKSTIIAQDELQEKYGIEQSFGGATMPAGAAVPYRLITGILTNLWQTHSDRFSIEAHTPAESITWSAETQQYTVHTPRGAITTKHVIHATNAHAGHLLPSVRGFLHPLRCQVTVQEKTPEWTNRGAQNSFVVTKPGALQSTYQSPTTSDFYVSGLTGTGDFFDEYSTREDQNDATMIAGLSSHLNHIVPSPVQGRVKANWTGIMAYTADNVPLVGRLGEDLSTRAGHNEFIAAGYNGVGMVTAWLSGEHIADLVLQRDQPRRIPAHFAVSKERIDTARLESVLSRTYGTWE